ncbi:hypothetical protein AAG906_038435 [Vitis piasezkii]
MRKGKIVLVDAPMETLTNAPIPAKGYNFSVKFSSDTYGHDLEGFRNYLGVLFDCRMDPPFVGVSGMGFEEPGCLKRCKFRWAYAMAMNPVMWYVELPVGVARFIWLQWQACLEAYTLAGAHSEKGPVRPLHRVLQGLDPRTTASMFADARCIGENKINSEDCFIIKLCVDPRSFNAVE